MNSRRPTEPKVRHVGFDLQASLQPPQPEPPRASTAPTAIPVPVPLPPSAPTAPIPILAPVPLSPRAPSAPIPIPARVPVPESVFHHQPRARFPIGNFRPGIHFRARTSIPEESSSVTDSISSEGSGQMSEDEFIGWFPQGMSLPDSEMMVKENANVNKEDSIAPPKEARDEITSSSQQPETRKAAEGLSQESMSADVSREVAPGRTANQSLQRVRLVRIESSEGSEQSSEDEWFPLSMSFSDNESTIERNVNVNPVDGLTLAEEVRNTVLVPAEEVRNEILSSSWPLEAQTTNAEIRALQEAQQAAEEDNIASALAEEVRNIILAAAEEVRNTILAPDAKEIRNKILSSSQQLEAQTRYADIRALQEAHRAAREDNIASAEEVINIILTPVDEARNIILTPAEEVRNEILSSSQQLEAQTTNAEIGALQETQQTAEDPPTSVPAICARETS